jgi:lysophospholipase L1-like esterase
MKIVILGNSVVLNMVPPRTQKNDGVFAELLASSLVTKGVDASVIISAEHGTVITEGLRSLERNALRHFPDVVIINYGIVDCTPRLFAKWWVNYVKMRSPWPIEDTLKVFFRKITSGLSNGYLRIIKGRSWVPISVFRKALCMMLDNIRRETMARIILVNIPPSTPKRDSAIKGLDEEIVRYNSAIEDIARLKGAFVIDAYRITQKWGVTEILPEGFHYNARGHALIAEEIVKRLDQEDKAIED